MCTVLLPPGVNPSCSVVMLFLLIVLFYVLFVCKCVLYYCHRVLTQLQLSNISISISNKCVDPSLLLHSFHWLAAFHLELLQTILSIVV